VRSYHSNTQSQRLAEVNNGIGIGNFQREEKKQLLKISINLPDPLLDEVRRLREKEFLFGKVRELSHAILLHVVLHFLLERLVKSEEFRVSLHDAEFNAVLLGKL
jgi:hypothetical protein